ncbi:MAG: hypothetical protein ACR2NA_08860 [Solirubrobacterales bacterium]
MADDRQGLSGLVARARALATADVGSMLRRRGEHPDLGPDIEPAQGAGTEVSPIPSEPLVRPDVAAQPASRLAALRARLADQPVPFAGLAGRFTHRGAAGDADGAVAESADEAEAPDDRVAIPTDDAPADPGSAGASRRVAAGAAAAGALAAVRGRLGSLDTLRNRASRPGKDAGPAKPSKAPKLSIPTPAFLAGKEMPPVVRDLYRDLNDRGLRFVPVGLLLLILAVPLFLSSSPATEPESATVNVPPAEIAARQALQSEAVVSPAAEGLRDYRKRLDAFKRKNPFRQQYRDFDLSKTAVENADANVGETADGKAVDIASALGKGGGSPGSPKGGDAPSTGGGGGAGGGGGGSTGGDSKPEPRFYTYTADLRIGEVGEAPLLRDVEPLTLLPSDEVPVTSYIGASDDLKRATFLIPGGEDVSSQGEGDCQPSPEDCTFLELEVGATQFIDVGVDDDRVTYELQLVKLERKYVDAPAEEGSDVEDPDGADPAPEDDSETFIDGDERSSASKSGAKKAKASASRSGKPPAKSSGLSAWLNLTHGVEIR